MLYTRPTRIWRAMLQHWSGSRKGESIQKIHSFELESSHRIIIYEVIQYFRAEAQINLRILI